MVNWLHEHTSDTIALSVASFLNPPYKAGKEILRELGRRRGDRVGFTACAGKAKKVEKALEKIMLGYPHAR